MTTPLVLQNNIYVYVEYRGGAKCVTPHFSAQRDPARARTRRARDIGPAAACPAHGPAALNSVRARFLQGMPSSPRRCWACWRLPGTCTALQAHPRPARFPSVPRLQPKWLGAPLRPQGMLRSAPPRHARAARDAGVEQQRCSAVECKQCCCAQYGVRASALQILGCCNKPVPRGVCTACH